MTDSNTGRSDSPDYGSSSGSGSGDSPWSSNWSPNQDQNPQNPYQQPGSASSSSSASDWPGYPSGSGQQPSSQPSASDPSGYGSYGGGDYGYQQQPYPPTPEYGANTSANAPYSSNPYETTPYQGGGNYPYGYAMAAPNHPSAVTAMVLGIVGLVICPFVGIGGFVIGGRARKEIDANPGRYSGRGMATAGWVLGIISIVYTGIVVLAIIFGVIGAIADGS